MPSSPASDGGEELQRTSAAEQGADAQPENEPAAELAQVEDRYRRALADLDNYRKRAAREIESRVAEAKESLLRDWLEAVDSVERAIRMDANGPCADGLCAIFGQMQAVLTREGAQRIGEAGDQFDPLRHEAIAVQPSEDVPDRTIVAVERSGYALGDRVIRPAQVVVARAPEHAT